VLGLPSFLWGLQNRKILNKGRISMWLFCFFLLYLHPHLSCAKAVNSLYPLQAAYLPQTGIRL
jgi:hypothetical protein